MSFRGVEFTPEMRQLVVNVKHFFSKHRKNSQMFVEKAATMLTALAMGISESNVRTIMVVFNKNGEDGLSWSKNDNRGRPSFFIASGVESAVRQFIRQSNKTGQQVTIKSIQKYLNESIEYKVATTTLWRALSRWGFEFGVGIRSAQLKESTRIIIRRRQYLRAKLANRRADGTVIRPEIYLDESYINKNHSKDSSWFLEEDNSILSKPTGKGERLVIVNAISKDGWIPNAKLVFKASKKTGDYHANMNWRLFSNWFSEKLLPNIPDNSIIIMDNAAYHNILTAETFPKPSHTMKKLREWLDHNSIPWREDMLKEELFDLCSNQAPKPEFALDRIAAAKGHSILRTPPYHPELQPIETCWAVVKGHVAAHNNFKMEKVKELLEEGFAKVTSKTIAGIMEKIRMQEDEFWVEDSKLEDQKESIQQDTFDADEG